MQVIPVLDLLKQQVVQGNQGQRSTYRPIQSVLVSTAAPVAVARALWAATNCQALYIADLDAIQGQGSHRALIGELATCVPAALWVDAGASSPASVADLLAAGASRVIIGSETLPDLAALRAIRRAHDPERLLFSLDMQAGRILAAGAEIRDLDPLALLALLVDAGWSHVILLPLDRVGTGQGAELDILAQAAARWPQLALYAAGGVRSAADLRTLAARGATGVLVATALHRGWITPAELAQLRGPASAAGG